jgi:lysyl-tRNA synthetase class 2
MMDTTEQMLEKAAIAVNGTSVATVNGEINFKAPYRRVTMFDAIKEHTGFDISAIWMKKVSVMFANS